MTKYDEYFSTLKRNMLCAIKEIEACKTNIILDARERKELLHSYIIIQKKLDLLDGTYLLRKKIRQNRYFKKLYENELQQNKAGRAFITNELERIMQEDSEMSVVRKLLDEFSRIEFEIKEKKYSIQIGYQEYLYTKMKLKKLNREINRVVNETTSYLLNVNENRPMSEKDYQRVYIRLNIHK